MVGTVVVGACVEATDGSGEERVVRAGRTDRGVGARDHESRVPFDRTSTVVTAPDGRSATVCVEVPAVPL